MDLLSLFDFWIRSVGAFSTGAVTARVLSVAAALTIVPMCLAGGRQGTAPNWNYEATMGHNHSYGLPANVGVTPQTSGTEIWGYDISQYQGSVNFSQLAGGSSFVIIREGYGAPDPGQTAAQYADANFLANRAAAETQGMEIGFYHYAYPDYNSADAEAASFCANVGSLRVGEFAVLDFERQYSGDVVAWCKTWLDDVQAQLGVRPLLYVNLSTEQGQDWSSVISGNYGLWLAYWDYNKTAGAPSTQWPFVALRQYSDQESAPGISGNVDGDVFYGDLDQLKAYGKGNPAIVSWTSLPPSGSVWYRSDEHMVYHIDGDQPNTVQEMIDGNVTATYSNITDGYIAFSYGSQGWHTYSVRASNARNQGTPSTITFQAGYDTTPPTAAWASGALPQTWYQGYNQIEFGCYDAGLAGIRQCHYEWDNDGFTNWAQVNGADVPLLTGKHHLYVEVEDQTYTGSQALGNRATYDLGEYWLYTVAMTKFYVTSPSLNGGYSTYGVTQFNGPGDSGGDQIALQSSSSDVQVPASVTLPSGKTGVSFEIQSSPVSASESVTLTANYGPFSLQTQLTLNPCPLSSFSLTNSTVNGGVGSEGILQLAGKAGRNGAVISLSSGSALVHVPASVTIGSGSSAVTFPITTDSSAIGGATLVATYGSSRLSVFLTIKQGLGSFYTLPSTVKSGSPSFGVAQISHAAPVGGITISLKSGSADVVLPARVTIPAGKTGVSFSIKTIKGGVGAIHLVATLGGSSKITTLTLTN